MMCFWPPTELVSSSLRGDWSYAHISGGITVTDTKTSEAIFEIGGVRPFAHLEFAKGFVTFDTGNGASPMIPICLKTFANS
jgi:hypothetical protein